MSEREPYSKPAEPVLVGSVEMSENNYSGSGGDFSIYSSLIG
ncbi:MAG: hypothetical protein NTZ03_14275 [Actinobacteria bacterium]|nr:hypothetical protein [Actinomycetota bacterium]